MKFLRSRISLNIISFVFIALLFLLMLSSRMYDVSSNMRQ